MTIYKKTVELSMAHHTTQWDDVLKKHKEGFGELIWSSEQFPGCIVKRNKWVTKESLYL